MPGHDVWFLAIQEGDELAFEAAADHIAAAHHRFCKDARGHYFMRYSFAGSTDRMIEAARRLKDWRK